MTEQRRLPSDKVPETSSGVPSDNAPETSRGVPSDKAPETSQERKTEKRDTIIRTMNSIIKNKTTRNLLAVLASTLLLLSASIEQREKPDSRRWEKAKEVATYTLEVSVAGTPVIEGCRNLKATSENVWRFGGVLADIAKKINDTFGINRLIKELSSFNDVVVIPPKDQPESKFEKDAQEPTSYQGAGSENNSAVTNPNNQDGEYITTVTVPGEVDPKALAEFVCGVFEKYGLTGDGTGEERSAMAARIKGLTVREEGGQGTQKRTVTVDEISVLKAKLKNGKSKQD